MTDTDANYKGRPFGGVAIICKQIPGLTYHELETSCDRLVAVAMCDRAGNIVQVLLNVYMPFYCKTNIDEYVATLDIIQAVIDQYAVVAPVKIIGDFNT